MANVKPGWNKVGNEFILYDNNLVEKERRSTDPKLDVNKGKQTAQPAASNQGVVNRINKVAAGVSGEPYSTSQAFDKIGVDNLNKLRKQFNLNPLPYGNPNDATYRAKVKAAAGEMQAAASQQYPELVKDYMTNRGVQPTNKLAELLGPRGYGTKSNGKYKLTNADLQKAIADKQVTDDEILQGYKDDLWHFRGLTLDKQKLKKDEYEKKMQQAGIAKGERKFFSDDPNAPFKYTEYEMEEDPANPPAPVIEDDKKIAKTDDKVVEDEKRKAIETNTPTNYNLPENGPWWLQDIIKTAGAASDLGRIKKYLPYQATPQVRLPDATFYDPTRELAANAEQANMAYQTQAAFTNPQQLAAASSVTQGQAAKNAADVMGRYNNLNVGLANQLSQERANIMNTASQNKANLDTQLWDKYTIANQQFDNSKAKARENLRGSYIDAITNRANTANLNSLYPQYAVDPSRGGFINFNPNAAKIKATDKYDYMDSLHKKAIQYSNDPIMQERYFRDMLSKGAGDSTDEDEYYNRLKKVNSRGYNKSKETQETEG
jgi:hypothetical protein